MIIENWKRSRFKVISYNTVEFCFAQDNLDLRFDPCESLGQSLAYSTKHFERGIQKTIIFNFYKRNSSALLELEPPIPVLPIVTNQFNFLGTTLYFYILFFCNRPFSFQDAHC